MAKQAVRAAAIGLNGLLLGYASINLVRVGLDVGFARLPLVAPTWTFAQMAAEGLAVVALILLPAGLTLKSSTTS
jgi:hypothetical protein